MSTRKRKRSSTPSPTPDKTPPKKLTGYERFCQRKRQRTENQGWQGRSLDYKETFSPYYQTNPTDLDKNNFYCLPGGTTAFMYFLYTVHPDSRNEYQEYLLGEGDRDKHMEAGENSYWEDMLNNFDNSDDEFKTNYINQRNWEINEGKAYGASKTGEGASKTGEGASKTGKGKKRKRIKSRKIKINPKMRGVFTRKAKRAKMTVKQYANHIIKKYKGKKKTKSQLKLFRQANFAKVAAKWKKSKKKSRK